MSKQIYVLGGYVLGGYPTYQEHYDHIKHIVKNNESKYTQSGIQFNDSLNPEHSWNQLAPSTEENL